MVDFKGFCRYARDGRGEVEDNFSHFKGCLIQIHWNVFNILRRLSTQVDNFLVLIKHDQLPKTYLPGGDATLQEYLICYFLPI